MWKTLSFYKDSDSWFSKRLPNAPHGLSIKSFSKNIYFNYGPERYTHTSSQNWTLWLRDDEREVKNWPVLTNQKPRQFFFVCLQNIKSRALYLSYLKGPSSKDQFSSFWRNKKSIWLQGPSQVDAKKWSQAHLVASRSSKEQHVGLV